MATKPPTSQSMLHPTNIPGISSQASGSFEWHTWNLPRIQIAQNLRAGAPCLL